MSVPAEARRQAASLLLPLLLVGNALLSSQVIHRTLIDVAENGTEAAAATAISLSLMSLRIPTISVNFNSPFLLAILSKDTDSILFCAKVANPKEA